MKTKKTIIGILGIVLIGALLFSYQAQGASGLWKYVSGKLQPVVSTWTLYSPDDFQFDDEIKPDGDLCANGQILKKTGADNWDCAADATGAGGSAIIFDIGDDGGNDSVDVTEIATIGDTNTIFTEPSADKILIAVGNNWPTADTATTASALVANPTDCAANQFAQSIVASGNLTCSAIGDADVPNDITIDLATLASTVTNATFTTALTVNTGTLTLTANNANNSVLTIGAGASSISGANTGDGTYAKDLVATSPITVNAGANVDNILVGADSDITIAMPAATNATAGHASAAHITAIEANTTHAADNTQAHSDYFLNSGSDIAGAGSGFTWGFNASAGSDCVMTFGDGTINVSTGALQVGGSAVQTGADLVDDAIASCANANACTLTADAITDNLILLADFAHSQDYGDFTIGVGESFTLDTGVVADNEIDYANVTLADFDYQTAWRVFYSDAAGDVTELVLGADGQVLTSTGAATAPAWEAAGTGDLKADGTVPLTANWDVGAFTITGTQFISDIAGGTTPFVVTSTTEVTNLRAATATALAGNGANCAAGSYALGVDASGAVESCTDATTEINSVVNGLGGTNLTCAAQSCAVDDAFLKLGGDIATAGTYDFGSASVVLEIPNAAAPTVDAAGEIAVDTTTDQLIYYGGAKRVVPYYHEKCFTIEDVADADDNVPIWSPNKAITITDVYCRTQGGTSAVITISDGTNALEAITCDADGQADDGSITNGAFTANERMEFDTGTVTGAVDWTNFCITYTITAD